MDLNIEQGISLEVEGEIGKFQTLPIENLINIAQTLQELVLAVAKYDITAKDLIHYDNFKIEITDFIKSSAVPVFALTPRISPTIHDVNEQRKELSEKLDGIFQITGSGDFGKIKDMYPDAERRNDMVMKLHAFTNSFGNSPVRVGVYRGQGQFENRYRVRKLTDKIKKNLLVTVADHVIEEPTKETAIATVQVTKRKDKKPRTTIKKVYTGDTHALSVTFSEISFNAVVYNLNHNLLCSYQIEDGVHIIKYDMFDLVGTGDSEDEARDSFQEEFDHLYDWLNGINESKLSLRLLAIKNILNLTVKEKNNE
ncbi:hypothetical protein [Parapedobacter tibetensis]|uniref:hypothetical protein n=1 Tax=Parapedobacter tibetensis TaxID=2972951 RepID=UPI00214D46E0|nr:hypothetical protein [Parapedobacter tibetensis]